MKGKVSERAPIIAGIMSGMSAKDVANECGCSKQLVYLVSSEIDYKWPERESAITGKEDQIRDMMAEGLTLKQVAAKLGINFNTLQYHCRMKGIKSGKWERTPDRIDEIIRKAGNDVKYIGGYAGRKSRITVRCDVCGGEFDIQYQWAIAHKADCPICKSAEREEKNRQLKAERMKERKQRDEKRAAEKAEQAKAEAERKYREKLHACPVCGVETIRPNARREQITNAAR